MLAAMELKLTPPILTYITMIWNLDTMKILNKLLSKKKKKGTCFLWVWLVLFSYGFDTFPKL